MAKHWVTITVALALIGTSAPPEEPAAILLRPTGVFDGLDGRVHAGW